MKRTGYLLTGAIIKPHSVCPSLTLWHNYSWSSTDSSRLSSDTSSSSSFSLDSILLKGLLHASPSAHAQRMVHATWHPVHPQLLPLQARSDSQPHRMSLSTVSGSRGTPTSTVRGVRALFTWSVPIQTLPGWGGGGGVLILEPLTIAQPDNDIWTRFRQTPQLLVGESIVLGQR